MPLTTIEHLDNLINHIDRVRNNCLLLGKRLIAQNQERLGLNIIARGFKHDVSKFQGKEWKYLHSGKDVSIDKLNEAIDLHRKRNSHHPEFHDGIHNMDQASVAEMVCDILARCQELGECFWDWTEENIIKGKNLKKSDKQYKWIHQFAEILLESQFVKK